MLYSIHKKSLTIGSRMRYITFGRGHIPLVLLPGLFDSLRTVHEQAAGLAYCHRQLAGRFRVYVFSRRDDLPAGSTTGDMAEDLRRALDRLGIRAAYLMGMSQGGIIAQYFAARYPAMTKKLILAVSSSRPNRQIQATLARWVALAQCRDYTSLLIDTIEQAYSPGTLQKCRPAYPLLGLWAKPAGFDQFLLQADACLAHDAYGLLEHIRCPTLVVGGAEDGVVGAEASRELAAKIPDSRLILYKGLRHAAYQESRAFPTQAMRFLAGCG